MTIERQYLRQLNESLQKNEAEEQWYIVPGDDSRYIAAINSEQYAKRKEEYQKMCTPIKVSSDLNTPFNAIVVEMVSDVFTDEIYYYEQVFKTKSNTSIDFGVIPVKYMGKEWDDNELSSYIDMTKKEFLQVIKSSSSLTQEQLDLFESVYNDYQNFGYFKGVTMLPATLPKIPRDYLDAEKEKALADKNAKDIQIKALEKLRSQMEQKYKDAEIHVFDTAILTVEWEDPYFRADIIFDSESNKYTISIDVDDSPESKKSFATIEELDKILPQLREKYKKFLDELDSKNKYADSIKEELRPLVRNLAPNDPSSVSVYDGGYNINAAIFTADHNLRCEVELKASRDRSKLRISINNGKTWTEPLNGRTPEDLKDLCIDLLKEQLM